MVTHDAPEHKPTPALAPGPGAYDPTLGALIDHLLVIQDHQGEIQEHQDAITAALAMVHARLEEVLP